MILRIVLVVLALLMATQAVKFGERVLGPLSPVEWVKLDTFPWVIHASAEGPSGLWLFVAGVVASFTLAAILQEGVRLFSRQAGYVSARRIVYLSVVLAAGAILYGAFAKPIATNGMTFDTWFLQYPASILPWLLVLPMVLVVLNFVRELSRATWEYEVRANGGQLGTGELAKELQALRTEVKEIDKNVRALREVLIQLHSGVRNDEIFTLLQGHQQLLSEQVNGIFRQLRVLSSKAGLQVQQPMTAAPPVVSPVTLRPTPRPLQGSDGVRLRTRVQA